MNVAATLRRLALGFGLTALVPAAGCAPAPERPLAPGVLLLAIESDGAPPVPDELRVFAFDDRGALFVDERMPASGRLQPQSATRLGSIALHLGETHGTVRLLVRGLGEGRRIGEGVLRLAAGQGEQTLLLARGLLGDGDDDGIPDEIDDCPAVANEEQLGCPTTTVAAPVDDAGPSPGPDDPGDAAARPG